MEDASPVPFGGESYADEGCTKGGPLNQSRSSPVPFGGESYADGRLSWNGQRLEYVSLQCLSAVSPMRTRLDSEGTPGRGSHVSSAFRR